MANFNGKQKLAALSVVEEGNGGLLSNAVLVQLRKDNLISATPIQNGKRGRPELSYALTGRAASFRNMAKNWK
jgi:hypothetical protein